jgi:hypothetical protein
MRGGISCRALHRRLARLRRLKRLTGSAGKAGAVELPASIPGFLIAMPQNVPATGQPSLSSVASVVLALLRAKNH